MRKAILTLFPVNRQIFFFDNRLEFLVCATVFDKPCILIDTIHEAGNNIRWLYLRLAKRGLGRLTRFIASKNVVMNSFLSVFGVVTTIKELKRLCDHTLKAFAIEPPCNLIMALFNGLKKNLRQIKLTFF